MYISDYWRKNILTVSEQINFKMNFLAAFYFFKIFNITLELMEKPSRWVWSL